MDHLLNSNQSDKLGGRSPSSIDRDIKAGRLPPTINIGRRRYRRESDIDAALLTYWERTNSR